MLRDAVAVCRRPLARCTGPGGGPTRTERSRVSPREAPPVLAASKATSRAPYGRGFLRRHARVVTAVIGVAAIAGFIHFVVPQLSALGPAVHRLRGANPTWLGFGVVLEALSLGGYIALFRTVFSCHGARIGWKASYEITMAGVVATKLFAAAGAAGVALTVWALRASGLDARTVARRVLTFEFFLYGVYAAAIVVVGGGLRTGLFGGDAPWTLTVAPAVLGAAVMVALLSLRALPADFERRMKPVGGARRGRRLRARLASAPWAVHDALGIAFSLIRERKPGLIGAIAYWGFDIATLWACFHAFGTPPPVAVIVMAYFVGALANALPLPGGIGGVEGGMIGAFLAFGTSSSLAILAVLSYRLISFWLPTVPGAAAYLQLRRTVGRWRDETRSAHRNQSRPPGRPQVHPPAEMSQADVPFLLSSPETGALADSAAAARASRALGPAGDRLDHRGRGATLPSQPLLPDPLARIYLAAHSPERPRRRPAPDRSGS